MIQTFPGGRLPGDLDPAKARAKTVVLVDCGIRQVVNLMEKDEVNGTVNLFSLMQLTL